jgi:poly-gamma-glutamate capsule biosynthesis protein CapA/YwtB (metallophosphatase superfamily)
MSRLGVDAVIGTHSHHVQSMGFDPETGMFIAWSIGDLLGDAQHNNDFYSILLDLEITRSGKTGKTRITGFNYTPIYQYYPGDGSLRLLRIREAIAAYENNYIGRVPEDVYQSMKTALSRIEARVEP